MPIGLKVKYVDFNRTHILFCSTSPEHETEEFELPVGHLTLDLHPGEVPKVTATFLASNLDVELDAVALTKLVGIGWSFVCIHCKDETVRVPGGYSCGCPS